MAEKESLPNLDFSDEARDDLVQLARHSEKLDLVASQSSKIKVGTKISEAESMIAESANMVPEQIHRIFKIIWNLNSLKNRLGVNSQKLIDIITSNFKQKGPPDWIEKYFSQWENSCTTIANFLDAINIDNPFFVARKGEQLRLSYQNCLIESRIITDLRPVFDSSAAKIEDFIITHTLLLHYYDGTESRRIAIAVDADDISGLRRICERAQVKGKTLEEYLKNHSSTPFIG